LVFALLMVVNRHFAGKIVPWKAGRAPVPLGTQIIADAPEAVKKSARLLRLRRLICGKPAAFRQPAQPKCSTVEPDLGKGGGLSAHQAAAAIFFTPSGAEFFDVLATQDTRMHHKSPRS
jgi:hypothetical protein